MVGIGTILITILSIGTVWIGLAETGEPILLLFAIACTVMTIMAPSELAIRI